jgi:hypothetical protein
MIIWIVRNPMDPGSWDQVETDNVAATLRAEFPTWPSLGRIYDLDGIGHPDRAVALAAARSLAARDVTPVGGDVTRLEAAAGPLLITLEPNDPITAAITVAVTLAAVAIGLFLMPKPPGADNTPSASKSLSDRSNKARPLMRIEDHFGSVRSVPSLIAVPYRRFAGNLEFEIALMCVGRGAFDLSDVRDGDSLIASIAGSAVEFYAPFTAPGFGAPQLRIGSEIGAPVLSIVSVTGVNGQLLRPPNANNARGDDDIRFVYPDRIETKSSKIDFTELFDAGDDLTIGGADFSNSGAVGSTTVMVSARFEFGGVIRFENFDPTTVFAAGQFLTVSNAGWAESNGISSTIYVDLSGGYPITAISGSDRTVTLTNPGDINTDWDKLDELDSDRTGYRTVQFSVPTPTSSLNLAGTYVALAVEAKAITLSNPSNVNAAWLNLQGLPDGRTAYGSPSLSTSGERWVGPFTVNLDDLDRVITNYVALSGLYSINKKGKQGALRVGIVLELTPVDSNGNATGPAETFAGTLIGSADDKELVGLTLDGIPTFTGPCKLRSMRTTPTDLDYDGTLVDDVKWRDAYGGALVDRQHFGNVTTVLSKTYATSGATSQKERKLNLRARRRVPRILADGTLSAEIGSDDAADIMAAVTLDPYIGARGVSDIDLPLLRAVSDEVAEYFGSSLAREFSYTFDDDNTSFEETIQTVAQAVFCQAYRKGSLIRVAFERATEDPALLFNHRNVLPDSQTRTVRFGILDDQDGVELAYTVPRDGAKLTITLPTGYTPTSPRNVELPGIGTGTLGYWHAQRAWNRMRYQNVSVELEATEEAALVLPQERVLITDMTRPDHLSGQVKGQDGTVLTLTDQVDLDPDRDYTMFVQLPDATVQAIGVTAWQPPAGESADPNRVSLSALPRLPLITDPNAGVRTIYSIAPEQDVQSRAFIVSEREPNSDFTETVRAVNYTFLYYQHDQLTLWLPFTNGDVIDESVRAQSAALIGGASTIEEAGSRGFVYSATAGGAGVSVVNLIAPVGYTKMAWVKPAAGAAGDIIGGGSASERFGYDGAGNLVAGHGSVQVAAPMPPAAEWHHVAVSYAPDGTMTLYADGRRIGRASGIARGLLSNLAVLSGLIGRFDDVRLYRRALTDTEVRVVYMASR